MDMMGQYQKNRDFREYVRRFCEAYKLSAEDALKLAIVRESAAYYRDAESEKSGRVPAVKSTYAPMGECK